jgi:hypothetical protein
MTMARKRLISPHGDIALRFRPDVGEMSPKATEGGAVRPASQFPNIDGFLGLYPFAPPSVLPDISPTRGEIGGFHAGAS